MIAVKTGVSGSRKQNGFAARDHDGVLVMSGETAVGRAVGPAVFVERNVARAGGDDWFDGDDQAFGQFVLRGKLGVVRHRRRLVDRAADAVAAKVLDDMKAAPAHFALNGPADVCREGSCAPRTARFTKGAL